MEINEINYVCSFGLLCHTASILKNNNLYDLETIQKNIENKVYKYTMWTFFLSFTNV